MSGSSASFDRYCRACRQSLRGVVSRRCPECGREFDPNDPRTTSKYAVGDFWQGLAAIGKLMILLAIGLAIIAIFYSALGFDPMWLFLTALAASHVWLGILIIAAMPKAPLDWRWRVLAVASVLVIASILVTNWPLCLSVAVHRPFLEPVADQVKAGQAIDGPRQVGIFRFRRDILHETGNVGFQLTGGAGGGVYLVREAPDSTRLWYNTNWTYYLGGSWHLLYED